MSGKLIKALFPHCDMNVLHEPGRCEFCDMYPDNQQERIDAGIAFTGQTRQLELGPLNRGLKPCPAELFRPIEVIEAWHGNVPQPKKNSAR